MDTFDPQRLALHSSAQALLGPTKPRQNIRHCQSGKRFLRGPVPMDWLNRAARLPGKALHVGIAIWHLAGLKKQVADIKLSSAILTDLGISRPAGYRGLKALEQAALVSVIRHTGRQPLVSLLIAEAEEP